MRLLKFTILAVFLCAVSASAQTVDEIVGKNLQAHGGIAKLKAIQSMRITGNFEISGMQAGFTQVYKRSMKVRMDATIQGLTLTQAYDGQNGWQVIPFTGKTDPEPMSAEDLKHIQEEADFDGPLLDYKQKGSTIQLVGKEKVGSADAYHLKITLKNGDVRNMYLDGTSFLTIKMVGKTTMQGTEVELESTFADYKQVQGVMFPFTIEQHATDGQVPSPKITFQKVEINIPVEDSIFKMPVAAPAPAPSEQPKKPDTTAKPPQ
jgi:hypothetical protein